MNRNMLAVLKKWKNSPRRKPMLPMGARQTGKSWILREFGRREFEHVISIDFEMDSPQVQDIGEVIRRWGLDAPRLLAAAGLDGRQRRLDSTLVVCNEVQRFPRMFTALKYIRENVPEAHVAASGSLMGLALKAGTRAPVGCVNVARMLPMTFYEYLEAAGEHGALDMLRNSRASSRPASAHARRLACAFALSPPACPPGRPDAGLR